MSVRIRRGSCESNCIYKECLLSRVFDDKCNDDCHKRCKEEDECFPTCKDKNDCLFKENPKPCISDCYDYCEQKKREKFPTKDCFSTCVTKSDCIGSTNVDDCLNMCLAGCGEPLPKKKKY